MSNTKEVRIQMNGTMVSNFKCEFCGGNLNPKQETKVEGILLENLNKFNFFYERYKPNAELYVHSEICAESLSNPDLNAVLKTETSSSNNFENMTAASRKEAEFWRHRRQEALEKLREKMRKEEATPWYKKVFR